MCRVRDLSAPAQPVMRRLCESSFPLAKDSVRLFAKGGLN